MRIYTYVGPDHILERVQGAPPGLAIQSVLELVGALKSLGEVPGTSTVTFTVSRGGVLHIADRHSEHVACAGFEPVLAAGELTVLWSIKDAEVLYITNQSTGFCPEPSCWPAAQQALKKAGLEAPVGFEPQFDFRWCTACHTINIVKEGWLVCACGADLPKVWNFDS